MNEIANDARWSWRPTVFVAGVELLLLLLLAIFQQDILFPLASAFVGLVSLVSNIVVLIYAASYTMKQAIEEGFILDVLESYTPVYSYYKLVKKTEDDPEFDTKKANKKLRRYVKATTTRSG